MSRRQKDPLRSLTDEERVELSRLSRSRSAPSAQVARATAVLAIAEGQSYTATARRVGRHNGDTVAQWVARFNHDGLAAVVPRHGGGRPSVMPQISNGEFWPRSGASQTGNRTARQHGP